MKEQPRRKHLHGDFYEGGDGTYYCAACDVFMPAEHFYTKSRCMSLVRHVVRYSTAIKAWRRYHKRYPELRRPEPADNLFEPV